MNDQYLPPKTPATIGIAADHGGYGLKEQLAAKLRQADFTILELGTLKFTVEDDSPDFLIPLAHTTAGRP